MSEEYKKLQEDDFEGGMSWGKKEIRSHKEIILNQIEKCRIELSKDLRQGGTYHVPTSQGVLPVYFPDQREVIVQCVETLYDLILWYFDETATTNIKRIQQELHDSYALYFKKYLDVEQCPSYKEVAIKTRVIQQGKYSQVGKTIEAQLGSYILAKYREMFRELILLFKRKNELSGKRSAGVY